MATARERAHARTLEKIVALGRDQLAEVGPARLSLREIARGLGMVSSAVYRYVASRDELLTLLIVDAYQELGQAVESAIAEPPDPRQQYAAAGHAVRHWALANPARYALVFGTPVPGYHAPAELTTGPGTRVIVALVRIFDAAWQAGALDVPQREPGPALLADLEEIAREYRLGLPPAGLAAAVTAWTGLFGAVSFEVFGQYGENTFRAPEELFEEQLAALATAAGLR
ncbi:TetR/AcrR family transcriptional regulator [Sediminivirga luteola]|uniref:TetR family transcriptional regulator n=1 Tax=Sediminivirga luteola TaxID=1774748 RepID=A0A8J2XL50_9MICO|nr:TetR/AcrR family transcriptional regulator [Sediminivirga luteola]GGA19712.1 TetR family transcriptional regulator [Sediminivirga luteola]